ncbi:MAG: hypothetical protein PHI90_07865, partial [Clostridia bacterium]|nr:hypothetical protein [Clostridia bacterium]
QEEAEEAEEQEEAEEAEENNDIANLVCVRDFLIKSIKIPEDAIKYDGDIIVLYKHKLDVWGLKNYNGQFFAGSNEDILTAIYSEFTNIKKYLIEDLKLPIRKRFRKIMLLGAEVVIPEVVKLKKENYAHRDDINNAVKDAFERAGFKKVRDAFWEKGIEDITYGDAMRINGIRLDIKNGVYFNDHIYAKTMEINKAIKNTLIPVKAHMRRKHGVEECSINLQNGKVGLEGYPLDIKNMVVFSNEEYYAPYENIDQAYQKYLEESYITTEGLIIAEEYSKGRQKGKKYNVQEDLIQAKKNIVKLGYGNVKIDCFWDDWFEETVNDFIQGYGLEKKYKDSGKQTLFTLIDRAVKGEIVANKRDNNKIVKMKKKLIKMGYTNLLIYDGKSSKYKKALKDFLEDEKLQSKYFSEKMDKNSLREWLTTNFEDNLMPEKFVGKTGIILRKAHGEKIKINNAGKYNTGIYGDFDDIVGRIIDGKVEWQDNKNKLHAHVKIFNETDNRYYYLHYNLSDCREDEKKIVKIFYKDDNGKERQMDWGTYGIVRNNSVVGNVRRLALLGGISEDKIKQTEDSIIINMCDKG